MIRFENETCFEIKKKTFIYGDSAKNYFFLNAHLLLFNYFPF